VAASWRCTCWNIARVNKTPLHHKHFFLLLLLLLLLLVMKIEQRQGLFCGAKTSYLSKWLFPFVCKTWAMEHREGGCIVAALRAEGAALEADQDQDTRWQATAMRRG
jgi:hypothetical protein